MSAQTELKRKAKLAVYRLLGIGVENSTLRKSLLPRDPAIRRRAELVERYDEDCQRFIASSAIDCEGCYREELHGKLSGPQLLSIINIEYHRIEKGLTLPARRPGAGQDVVIRLALAIKEYMERFGEHQIVRIGRAAIRCYENENANSNLQTETKTAIYQVNTLANQFIEPGEGGFITLSREEIIKAGRVEKTFFRRRHSIRDYDDRPVTREILEQIIDWARYTPSVCNRQGWKAHVVQSPGLIAECLSLQNGNRGFADKVKVLLVVTSDLHAFVSVEERNQGWIDGGLFSMALMYSIHANGLGSCPLNWCATKNNDLKLRNVLGIPANEVVIMMLSVGYLPERTNVAISSRKSIGEIAVFH